LLAGDIACPLEYGSGILQGYLCGGSGGMARLMLSAVRHRQSLAYGRLKSNF